MGSNGPNWNAALQQLQQGERNDACAAVIHFVPGTSEAKAKRFLEEMVKRGIITDHTCREYNSHGGNERPVWYIP